MVKIKADENIPKSTIVFLKEYGFEVKSVSDEDLLGHGDEDISHFAKGEGRIIITLDKDFGSYLKFPTMASCGVILLRLKHAHPAYVNARLREFFGEIDSSILTKSLIVVSERKIRVRKIVI